jgi:DNA-binding helix-hairpin-helix protein with protein kinase domain
MTTPEVIDGQGKQVRLGKRLNKGGEGAVYDLPDSANNLAKIYLKPPTVDRVNKIKAMPTIRSKALLELAAWPIDLLRDRNSGNPIGFIMPNFPNRKDIHHLYGPKSRLQAFPGADWRFLVRAAANSARAFAVVHDAGHAIGDVNHGSVLVARDATVKLVDCDSFQVSSQGRQYLCDVGVETFTPPELQGVSFRGIVRTPNHDNFGLSVMIFHLLFMGRHPFAGRFLGAGDMPIARAIKECRFPYSVNLKAMQMEPPPGTPPLLFVGADVAQMFERAFSQAAINNTRPTARAWADAMHTLEKNTKRCGTNAGHWHPGHLLECPWCRMEAQGANPLFPFVVPFAPGSSGPMLDLEALWRQLNGLPALGPAPMIPVAQASPSQAARKLGKPENFANSAALVAGFGTFAAASAMFPPLFFIWAVIGTFVYNIVKNAFAKTEEVGAFRKTMNNAESNFKRAESDWHSRAGEQAFEDAKRKFVGLKNEMAQIPAKRIRALDQLKQSQRKLQLDRFLDRFELEDANIDGIGPGRKRTLESYGIETAEDIVSNRIYAVPGFGPKMIERLMRWRRSIETKFVFDPAKAIDPRDIAKVEQDIQALRTKTSASAKAAHAEAMQAHVRIKASRQTMRPQLDALQAAFAQAQADYKFVS